VSPIGGSFVSALRPLLPVPANGAVLKSGRQTSTVFDADGWESASLHRHEKHVGDFPVASHFDDREVFASKIKFSADARASHALRLLKFATARCNPEMQ
jgi:hypothetical protein